MTHQQQNKSDEENKTFPGTTQRPTTNKNIVPIKTGLNRWYIMFYKTGGRRPTINWRNNQKSGVLQNLDIFTKIAKFVKNVHFN